jgi:hypothetical protein
MKKQFAFWVLIGFFFAAGFVLVNTALALPDADCYCRNNPDMWRICGKYCQDNNGVGCALVQPDPTGTCMDQDCYTYFTFWCDENLSLGRSISRYEHCFDCYEN